MHHLVPTVVQLDNIPSHDVSTSDSIRYAGSKQATRDSQGGGGGGDGGGQEVTCARRNSRTHHLCEMRNSLGQFSMWKAS